MGFFVDWIIELVAIRKIDFFHLFFFVCRETKAYYSVIVTATDNGIIPFARSSTSTLVIYVTDENDNAPVLVSLSPFFLKKCLEFYVFHIFCNYIFPIIWKKEITEL